MLTKKLCLYERFFVLIRNFTTEHVRVVKIPGFVSLSCQTLGFTIFVQATLFIVRKTVRKSIRFCLFLLRP